MPSRRTLLAGFGAAALTPSFGWAAVGRPVAVSAAQLPSGGFALIGLDQLGDITFQIPLPGRGHAAAAHPHLAEVVAIARRPGTFARVVDCATGQLRQTLAAPRGRHFYGHGAFTQDGSLLFTTENDINTGAGRIGVWERHSAYIRIGEFASGGIGPHEILRMPDGNLAVANGGIRTHPDSGREKLNLDTMRGNLSIFSAEGTLLDQAVVSPDTHLNSLRHIAVQTDGTIACGFQWQGDPYDAPALLALYRGNAALRDVHMDEDLLRALDGYIGSVAAHVTDGFIASSPRGGRVLTFAKEGLRGTIHRAHDVCGLAQCSANSSLVTDGNGHVYRLESSGLRLQHRHKLAFDNHLVTIAET